MEKRKERGTLIGKKNCLFAYAFMSVVLSLMMSGCGKIDLSDYIDEEEEGYKVTFSVGQYTMTDFEESLAASKTIKRTRKEAKELGSVLNFAVFNGDEKVKSINQKSEDSDFGKVSVSLPEGTYQMVVLIHSCEDNATITSPDRISFPNNKVTDTFAYFTDMVVSGNSDKEITVDRVVAKYHLTINDAIPEEVKQLKFYYTGGSSTLDATTGFGCVNSRQTEYRVVGNRVAGQQFDVYTFPHDISDNLKMTITALDDAENSVEERIFEGVPVEVKKVTNHTCALFGGGSMVSDGSSFGIGGDNAWTGEIKY